MKRWATSRSRKRGRTFVIPPFGGSVRCRQSSRLKAELRTGFTLIEMLVAVTLVMIMMVMFAEIFQLAGASVTKQRALADNDQNARIFVTVIRADLDKRTVRTVVPFFAGELALNPGTPFGSRRGYVEISCNNNGYSGTPEDGTDDVLQFTADVRMNLRNSDESPNFGMATTLGSLIPNPNQPEADDGQIIGNNAGASRAAEISFWMRGGKLYRRVMLLRDPIPAAGVSPVEPSQPTTSAGTDYFRASSAAPYTGTPLYLGNVWGDFDYSIHRLPSLFVVAPLTAQYAMFNGLEYLANDTPPLTGAPGFWTPALAQPWNRFGHDGEIAGGGLPREFSASTTPNFFFGRFTQQETSDTRFRYPHLPALGLGAAGNAMDGNTVATPANTLLDTSPNDGVVDQFSAGGRAGVDLLLSHVHEFRVEVWDQRLNDFAPVGHTLSAGGIAGDYHIGRRLNSTYGPLGGAFNVYDSWHPRFNRNNNLDVNGNQILGDEPDRPPYRPLNYDPTGLSGSPFGPSGTPVTNWPQPGATQSYSINDIVFPRREDRNGNGYLDPGEDGSNGFPGDGALHEDSYLYPGSTIKGFVTEDWNGNGIIDGPETDGYGGLPTTPAGAIESFQFRTPFFPTGLTFCYRCIRSGTVSPLSILDEPTWSTTPGHIMRGRQGDLNGDGDTLDPGEDEPDWLVEYNVRPLRAIRITVRFEHPSSKQMRQVTIVHSLRDTTAVP